MKNINNFLINYNVNIHKKIQSELPNFLEFKELQGLKNEPIPELGKPFKHQEIIRRLLVFLDVIIAFHDPGTGKTKLASYAANSFLADPDAGIDNVVILTKNEVLLREFLNGFISDVSSEKYVTDKLKISLTEKERMSRIKRSLSKSKIRGYTYETFANEVRKLSDDRIKEEYSFTFFIADELHLLRTDIESLNQDIEFEDKNKTSLSRTNQQIYKQIKRVFKLSEWTKAILLTATPTIDAVKEIGPIFNLALTLLGRNLFDESVDFEKITAKELNDYMYGVISVVRSLDNGVDLIYPGAKEFSQTNDPVKIKVTPSISLYPVTMSKFQTKYYMEAYDKEFQKEGGIYQKSRQASMAVMPDGTYGKKAFYDNVIGTDEKNKARTLKANSLLSEYISDDEKLKKISIKAYSFVTEEYKHSLKERPGKSWAFSDYAWYIYFSVMCLKQRGFEWYNGQSNPIDKVNNKIILKPKPRVAYITDALSATEIDNIKTLNNHPDNLDGKYLQSVLGSQKGRTGINLLEADRSYYLGPNWNEGTSEQSGSRVKRSSGHVLKLTRLRMEKGNPEARFKLQVKKMVSLLADNPRNLNGIELYMYLKSRNKQIPIDKLRKIYSSISVDCLLNYQRNRDENLDYECLYKNNDKNDKLWDNNYLLLYADDKLKSATRVWKKKFRNVFTYEYNDIDVKEFVEDGFALETYEKIKNYSLADIIQNDKIISNKFGVKSHIVNYGDFLMLSTDKDIECNGRFYIDKLFLHNEVTLLDILEKNKKINVEDISKFDIKTIDKLPFTTQINILEKGIIENDKNIMNYYEPFIFKLPNIDKLSEELQKIKLEGQKGRPTKSENLNKKQIRFLESYNKYGEYNIYVHTYASRVTKQSFYGITHFNESLRILDPKTKQFRNVIVTNYELNIYEYLIDNMINKKIKDTNKKLCFYGIENAISKVIYWNDCVGKSDKAESNLSIDNLKNYDLYNAMYKLNINIELKDKTNTNMSINNIKKYLLKNDYTEETIKNMDDDELRYHYNIIELDYSGTQAKNLITDELKKQKRILVL